MILKQKHYIQGFSLVELMVAMVIGLIIMSGAFSMHGSTRKTQVKSEEQMDMVADARFAIEMIAYDLRHAGSWGGTNKDGLITCKSTDSSCASPLLAANDCAAAGDPVWAFDLSRPIFATNSANPFSSTCIPTSLESYQSGTDILEMRYANANIVDDADLRAGQAYVRSNFINGQVFVGATPPALRSYELSSLTANHELHAYAYYISDFTDASDDGIPSLRRVALVNGPEVQTQTLVSGVVDLQVRFGVDTTDDGNINRYDSPDTVTADDNWFNVYAAKIWLLMRTDKKQKGVDTTKSFEIAGATVSKGGQDGYRYFLVSSVVDMRNLKQL